ncbi:MAG: tubulin/FtsZ family protein [Halodesulfurarchaeum sp.]
MKLAMIGVGQAGGKVLERFVEYDSRTEAGVVEDAIAVNTARADLTGLDRIPESNRVLVGQSRVKGHGVGADNELGAEITEEDIDEIQGAIDRVPTHEIDAFLIIAALGGGTGSGGSPVLAKYLKRIYTEPVYGLGILPAKDEGGIYTLNAARSLRTFVSQVDNLLLFDNDAWRKAGESVSGGYDEINEEIATRFGVLFSSGEAGSGADVGESVVDSSEVINTLSDGGISTLGYAAEPVNGGGGSGFVSRLFSGDRAPDDSVDTTNRITSLTRKAALGRLTLPCDISGAERALLVVAGPRAYLNRKGIEKSRKWLEEETGSMEIRGGDYPVDSSNQVAVAVLLSNVSDVPRISELQGKAVEAQDTIRDIRDRSEAGLEDLITDENDELDPLF